MEILVSLSFVSFQDFSKEGKGENTKTKEKPRKTIFPAKHQRKINNKVDTTMFKVIFVISTIISAVQSACDNACSGHGCCGAKSVCECFDNWGIGLSHLSGDCSERICPYEIAWVDTPDAYGTFHKYAECANKGICNRATGECECFPGYEGKGCQRTSCPNDCSGHGRCKFIENLPFGAVAADYPTSSFYPQDPHEFTYYNWDNYKTRGCVCDPEYGDVDCSKRLCQYGNDIMDQRPDLLTPVKYQTQKLMFVADTSQAANADKTFALTFKSKLNETFTTNPIKFYKVYYTLLPCRILVLSYLYLSSHNNLMYEYLFICLFLLCILSMTCK